MSDFRLILGRAARLVKPLTRALIILTVPLCLVVLAPPACGGGGPNETEEFTRRLDVEGGGSQVGFVNSTLPVPVQVRVEESRCTPSGGCQSYPIQATVSWTASSGTVPATTSTGSDGRSSVSWTLGSASGPTSLTASILTGHGDPTLITKTTSASAIAHRPVLAVVFGDNQVAPPGSTLPSTIVVQLTDTTTSSTRVPLPGVTVTWSAVGVGATVTPSTGITDAQGRVSSVWKLAATTGPQALGVSIASSPTNDPASVTQTAANAIAQLAPARVLRVVSGGNQVGIVGRALRSPIVVEYVTIDVTSGVANAVVLAPITFTPTATHGTASPVTVNTDLNGRASVQWTLGNVVGTQSMVVSTPVVAGFDAASVFNFTVGTIAEPVNIVLRDDFLIGNQWQATASRNDFNAWTFSRTVMTTGGNPGGFARMSHSIVLTTNPTFASIFSQFLYTGGGYNPSTQGPITSIDYAVDRQTEAGVYDAFVVTQNNVEYRAEFAAGSVFSNTSWQAASLLNLTPANFSPSPGPNFTAAGGPMQFGYSRGSSQRFAGFSHTHDVDNWVVTIKR